ncbi:DUF2513 domain-containing protein [Bradyrhizobium liaoningense]|uniref:DUF2513 domain-containing protein n=1 Tax=Bradyrhizobium liaoningense TaxID=43992 RepID=UPI001BAA7238|nr:DUF2513 domain-containing protein [Bradyrhizobium liaoningense]MBR0855474.1 DUF2513 domain-containing protein [Bradyrhizobium liaoningense]
MKRDMEYVRELLLKIEAAPTFLRSSDQLLPNEPSDEQVYKLIHHMAMLVDEVGFIRGLGAHTMSSREWIQLELTWRGHEFLETVRDPEVWSRTVAGAKKAGNWGLDFMVDIAKAYGKHVVKERLGVEL